jgi:phytoene dehydrogenase-like protein
VAALERAADDHKYGRVSERPFLEMTIPSITDPSLVDGDGHVASVLVHFVPYAPRDTVQPRTIRTRVEKAVLKTLEELAPGFADRVVARQVLLPADIESEYGVTQGCLQHLEPGLDQFFAWRPMLGHARYRLALPGLYLAGPGAHPGGGISGAPGANAAREIETDLRTRSARPGRRAGASV